MQTIRSSRYLSQLGWEARVAARAGAPASSASTKANGAQPALPQHRASPVSTSTPCGGLGRAIRRLTTGSRITPSRPSLPRICWRASASSRVDHVMRHGTLSRNSSSGGCFGSSSSNNNNSLTAIAGVAVLPRGAGGFARGPRESAASPAAVTVAAAWRGVSSSAMSEREFHLIADEALEDIHDAVEEALEDGFAEEFDCNMSVGATLCMITRKRCSCLKGCCAGVADTAHKTPRSPSRAVLRILCGSTTALSHPPKMYIS